MCTMTLVSQMCVFIAVRWSLGSQTSSASGFEQSGLVEVSPHGRGVEWDDL